MKRSANTPHRNHTAQRMIQNATAVDFIVTHIYRVDALGALLVESMSPDDWQAISRLRIPKRLVRRLHVLIGKHS